MSPGPTSFHRPTLMRTMAILAINAMAGLVGPGHRDFRMAAPDKVPAFHRIVVGHVRPRLRSGGSAKRARARRFSQVHGRRMRRGR